MEKKLSSDAFERVKSGTRKALTCKNSTTHVRSELFVPCLRLVSDRKGSERELEETLWSFYIIQFNKTTARHIKRHVLNG